MKIKEVIEKTGLTDRAIRLYIENELIMPENQQSYAGRNNFNFSEADVERLMQIALLRKADFSLEQIKILSAGGENAQNMLCEYLKKKESAVLTGQNILEALKCFAENTPVTIESVCERIEQSLAHTPLPAADAKPTAREKVEQWAVCIISFVFIIIFGALAIGVLRAYGEDFPFPKFYTHPINYIGVFYIIIPIAMAVLALILYRKYELIAKKRKKRRWVAGIALALAFVVAIQPLGVTSLMMIPPVYSETDDPYDYLVLGNYTKAYGDDIYKLFPANIPHYAIAEGSAWYPPDKFKDTTKYYYYFQNAIDPSFRLYAEWVLPEEEFAAELARIANYYPEGAKQTAYWGDWVCLGFTEDTLDRAEAQSAIDYYYLIFAYNEKTGCVRYIASYSMDCGREEDPYFVILPWE